jgi:hypothetical protein
MVNDIGLVRKSQWAAISQNPFGGSDALPGMPSINYRLDFWAEDFLRLVGGRSERTSLLKRVRSRRDRVTLRKFIKERGLHFRNSSESDVFELYFAN